jgi:general stress protein YciG
MSERSEYPKACVVCDEVAPVLDPPRPKLRRGFAAMSPEKQREIARKGGRASHEKGTGYEWTTESARIAGRKGGLASRSTAKSSRG